MAIMNICKTGNCDKPVLVIETDTIPRKGEMVSVSKEKEVVFGMVTRIQYRYYSNTNLAEVTVIIDDGE